MNPIAVTLLTGFLGAGKTTLLRHILNEQHGYKIAVIENEFGEVSVDDQLIGDRATQIKTLTNGCICTGMADPGPIIQTFFSHEILCQRYLLDGVIALVDAVHADEQMNQFTIAQSQVGYADRILLTKTDVAGEAEKLRERLARINARAPVYTVTHGDIDLGLLFNTNGFMLEENVVSTKPRFHFIADKQNDISSIVVELDYPVDISEVSRVMENLLLESADKLLRYKGMLWIDGEPNRLLFQGVQRLYSADWDRPWGDEKPHSTMVFIGIQLPEEEIRAAFAGLRK